MLRIRVSQRHVVGCGLRRDTSGVTLVEVMAAIAVASLLMAVLFPAIQSARGTAQKMVCQNRLKQLGLAAANYESLYGRLPPLSVDQQGAPQRRDSAFVLMFPMLGLQTRADNDQPGMTHISDLVCPSASVSEFEAPILYQCNVSPGLFSGHSSRGPFSDFDRSGSSFAQATDGLSQTMLFSEAVPSWAGGSAGASSAYQQHYRFRINRIPYSASTLAAPWANSSQSEIRQNADQSLQECAEGPRQFVPMSRSTCGDWRLIAPRYTHWFGPNASRCEVNGTSAWIYFVGNCQGASSDHHGGVNVCSMGGRITFINETIDKLVWRALGTANGGENGVTQAP